MNRLKLALGVSTFSLMASGCWIFTTFPLDGTNGMQGEYGGLLERNLEGRDTTYTTGTPTSVDRRIEESEDTVISIDAADEGGAIVLGLECDLPVGLNGPTELSLGGDVTCTQQTRDETRSGGGFNVVTERIVTHTFNELTVTRGAQPREMTLEASGTRTEVVITDGVRTRESTLDFEYAYEGTRLSPE